MAKKHLIIKDADEDIEYDVEEIDTEEEMPIEEDHKEEVCPKCGKEPCECEAASEAVVFTEEEIAALKDLISIVPALKKLLEEKPEEKPEEKTEESKSEEHEEIKEIEEIEEPEETSEEDEELSEEELDESVTDSVGSLEHAVGDGKSEEFNSAEATMAERFKKYYGGN